MTAPARDPLESLGHDVADAMDDVSARDLARQRERFLAAVDHAPRRAWRAPVLAAMAQAFVRRGHSPSQRPGTAASATRELLAVAKLTRRKRWPAVTISASRE